MILLICILAVLALFMLDGYKKGMVRIVLSLLATVAAVILAFMLTPVIKDSVKKTDAYDKIVQNIEKHLDESKVFNADSQNEAIEKLEYPELVKDFIKKYNNEETYEKLGVTEFKDYVANMISDVILTATVFMIAYIVLLALIKIVINVLDWVSKLPLINEFNKLGGIIIGAVHGIIIVWIFFVVVNVFANTDFAVMVFDQVNQSSIVSAIYDNNILMKLFLKLLA